MEGSPKRLKNNKSTYIGEIGEVGEAMVEISENSSDIAEDLG
jgi:hypothetical protein